MTICKTDVLLYYTINTIIQTIKSVLPLYSVSWRIPRLLESSEPEGDGAMFEQNQYDTGVPIYLQIIRCIKQKIIAGDWAAGDRVPPVRDLALEFGVNPNTMQRSLSELERDGLLYSERTSGRFITRDTSLIDSVRNAMARDVVNEFRCQMAQMGYTDAQILQQLQAAQAADAALPPITDVPLSSD